MTNVEVRAAAQRPPHFAHQPLPLLRQQAGMQQVPMQQVPMQQVPMQQAGMQQVPIQQAGMQQVPMQQVPMQQVPMQQAGMQQVPMQQVPMQQVPMQQVPMQQVPIQQVLMQQVPMQQVPMQQVPMQQVPMQQAGMQQVPIQQAGMQQVPMQQVPMQQVPMQQAGMQQVPMQQVPMQQVPMQQVPMQQVPIQQVLMQQVPMQQVPIQQVPIQQVPMQQVPMQQVPMQQVPMQQVPMQQAGMQQVPMQQVPMQQVPMQQVPMQQAGMQQVPMQQVPMQQVPMQQAGMQQVPSISHFPGLPPTVKLFLQTALRGEGRADFQCRSLIVSGESGSGKTTLVRKSIPAWLEDENGGNIPQKNLTVHHLRASDFNLDENSLSLAADEVPAADEATADEATDDEAADEAAAVKARNRRNKRAWHMLEHRVCAPQQNKEAGVVYVSIDEAGPTPNLVRALVSAAAQPTKYHKQFAGFKCVILSIAGTGANEMVCVDGDKRPGTEDGHYTPFTISSEEWRLDLKNHVIKNVPKKELFAAMLKDIPVLDKLAENARALYHLSCTFVDLTGKFMLKYTALSVQFPGNVPLQGSDDGSPGGMSHSVVTGPLATYLLLDTIRFLISQNGLGTCSNVPMLALQALSLVAAADVDEIDWGHRDVKELVRRYGVLQWHAHESGDSATAHRLRVTVSDSSTVLLMSCARLLPPLSSSCEHQIAVLAGVRTRVSLLLGAPAPRWLFWEEMSAVWMWLRLCALQWYASNVTVWSIVCTAFSRTVKLEPHKTSGAERVARMSGTGEPPAAKTRETAKKTRGAAKIPGTAKTPETPERFASLKKHTVWRQPEPRQICIMALEQQLQPSSYTAGLAQLKQAFDDFEAVVAINAAKAAFADAVVLLPGLVLLLQVTDVEGLSSADVLAECRKNGLIDPERAFPKPAAVPPVAEAAIPSDSPRRKKPREEGEEGDASTDAPSTALLLAPVPTAQSALSQEDKDKAKKDAKAEEIACRGRELTKQLASIVQRGDVATQCVGILFSSHPVTDATSSTDATFADNCSAVVMAPKCEARAEKSAGSKGACANMTFLLALVRCMHPLNQ